MFQTLGSSRSPGSIPGFPASFCFSLPVAILLKDDYFIGGAGLPGRFKAEKVEFHWGPSNGSEGSEHSVNGRRFPVEVRPQPRRPGTNWQLAAQWRSLALAITAQLRPG